MMWSGVKFMRVVHRTKTILCASTCTPPIHQRKVSEASTGCKFDPHLDHETGVHIIFMDAASGAFMWITMFQSLFATFNSATSSNHPKSIVDASCVLWEREGNWHFLLCLGILASWTAKPRWEQPPPRIGTRWNRDHVHLHAVQQSGEGHSTLIRGSSPTNKFETLTLLWHLKFLFCHHSSAHFLTFLLKTLWVWTLDLSRASLQMIKTE